MLPKAVSRSLRVKVTLGVVLPLFVILGLFTAIEYSRHQQTQLASLALLAAQTNRVIEGSLQQDMLPRNLDGIQQTLDALSDSHGIRGVYLLDVSGKVIFAPHGRGVGDQLDNRDPTCQPCHGSPQGPHPTSVVVPLGDTRVFRSMIPIENDLECQGCHDPKQRLLGLLLTDISMEPLEASLSADLTENLLWWAGTILATVLIVNLAMSGLVIRRLESVARALGHFGREQLSLRLPDDGPDEIGHIAGAFNDMAGRIETEEAENRALSEDLRRHMEEQQHLLKRLITVQEDERRRVARDLHDDLGQDLAGLAVGLEAVERLWAVHPEQARERLQTMRGWISETTDRTYDMILALRPPSLDDLGLVPALHAQADRMLKGTGIRLMFEACEPACRFAPDIETAVFRTVQEGLSNVVRHSGAHEVRVRLERHDTVFEAELSDDGNGFDPQTVQVVGSDPRGLGILGMQERVAQVGGHLDLESAPGRGTRVRIRVPLMEAPCGSDPA